MSVSTDDLVQLPRVGAQAALALGRQVLAAAKAQKVPTGAAKARTKLTAAHTALQEALVDQFDTSALESPEASEPAIQELDRILDNCWAGLDDRLGGLTRLPEGTEGAAEAAALRSRLFPKGLSFLKLPYKIEWSESQTRLQLIEREGLGAQIETLAGKPFLPAVRAAHLRYGQALGMHDPLPGVAAAPSVRAAFDAFLAALRAYVVKVVASIDEDHPETQEVADALLAPISAWAAAAKRARTETAPASPDTPAPAEASADPAAPKDK